MVIYAAVVQESVIDLFMAGDGPGPVAVADVHGIGRHLCRALASWAPALRVRPPRPEIGARRCSAACPWSADPATILGGMYFGVVTPTEAAAFGCVVAALLGFAYREMSIASFREALRNAIVTNAVVMFIIINSQILSFALAQRRHRPRRGQCPDGARPRTVLLLLHPVRALPRARDVHRRHLDDVADRAAALPDDPGDGLLRCLVRRGSRRAHRAGAAHSADGAQPVCDPLDCGSSDHVAALRGRRCRTRC